jgi:hypothetical protein
MLQDTRGAIVIRYLFLLTLLSCARAAAPPREPAPPAEPAPPLEPDVVSCDWNRPDFDQKGPIEQAPGSLIVENPGREPRAVRLYRKPSVDKVRFTVHKSGRARKTLGAAPPEAWDVYPSAKLDVEWRLLAADAAGRRQVSFRVVDAVPAPSGDGHDPLANATPPPELALVGLIVGYAAEPNGAFVPLTHDMGRFPESAYLFATFPDQPVGVGATWGKTDVISGGINLIGRQRFHLLDVAGDRLRVGFEYVQGRNGHRQFLDDGTPQEYTAITTARGEVVVDLDGAPVEATWKLTSKIDMAQCKAEKLERTAVDMETNWTWTRN